MQDIEKRLSKAKTQLILDHPFYGNVALNMPFSLSENIPTACTNGKEVIFNPKFVDSLTDDELKFLVAHECLHPMLEHIFRRGQRHPKLWNMACDYPINHLLVEDNVGKMPECGLYDPDIYQQCDGKAEKIYKYLEEEMPEQNQGEGEGQGQGGGNGSGQITNDKGQHALDDCDDATGSPAEVTQQEAEWKVKVAQAAQAAKMMGKLSAGAKRFVDEILAPKVDWRDVLNKFVQKHRTDDRSFSRPNRRFLSQGLLLPSISGEAMPAMVVAVDCSGSIGNHELNQFAAEIRKIQEDLLPAAIHVLYFDSEISHYDKFGPDDELKVEPHGGGGTAFSPIFKYVDEHAIETTCCVVLTDMCCSDYGPAPEYPVLWVSTYNSDWNNRAKFGEVICMAD